MKKIIIFLVLAIGIQSAESLHAQRVKYYYYPSSNVYYNPSTREYVYFNNNTWTPVTTLPGTIRVQNTRRYMVYHNGPDVWTDNEQHMKKYRAYGKKEKHERDEKHEKRD
jgi:hypothetical protein